MPRIRVVQHVSAGGVLVRPRATRFRACLIRRRQDGRVVWGLPKGHVEAGETLPQTAAREAREETGIAGDVVARLGMIRYRFALDARTRCVKRVHFYLLQARAGRLSDHDDEVEQVAWVELAQAARRLTYPGERAILRRAITWLDQHDGVGSPLRSRHRSAGPTVAARNADVPRTRGLADTRPHDPDS